MKLLLVVYYVILIYFFHCNGNLVHKKQLKDRSIGEEGPFFEGDIVLTPSQKEALSFEGQDLWRVAFRELVRLWPDKTVPYIWDHHSSFTDDEKNMIIDAMKYIEKNTCIKFKPHQGQQEQDHMVVTQEAPGCWANLGRGKIQKLNLSGECMINGTIVHEMLHILGFFHAHAAPNRDQFIDIKWKNLNRTFNDNFKKLSKTDSTMLDLPYDYDSILHYPQTAFSVNGEDTIVPKKEGVKIGQRIRLSELDVKRINKLYKC
ncbi:hypothetical protein DMENIID0001_171320 [Sergentomyia squamirostris]